MSPVPPEVERTFSAVAVFDTQSVHLLMPQFLQEQTTARVALTEWTAPDVDSSYGEFLRTLRTWLSQTFSLATLECLAEFGDFQQLVTLAGRDALSRALLWKVAQYHLDELGQDIVAHQYAARKVRVRDTTIIVTRGLLDGGPDQTAKTILDSTIALIFVPVYDIAFDRTRWCVICWTAFPVNAFSLFLVSDDQKRLVLE